MDNPKVEVSRASSDTRTVKASTPPTPRCLVQPTPYPMKNHALIAVLLLLVPAVSVTAADASANWEEQCAKCHGADGKGQTKMGKKLKIRDYTDAAVQSAFTDEEALKALKEGVKDKGGKQVMKAVEGLSEDDLKALVQHVRSLKA